MESLWLEHSVVLRNPKHCGLCSACQGEQGDLSAARLSAGKMEEALLGHPAQEQGAPASSPPRPARMELLTWTSASLRPQHPHPPLGGMCCPPKTNKPFSGCIPFPPNRGRKPGTNFFPRPSGVGSRAAASSPLAFSAHLAPFTIHATSSFVMIVACRRPPCTTM